MKIKTHGLHILKTYKLTIGIILAILIVWGVGASLTWRHYESVIAAKDAANVEKIRQTEEFIKELEVKLAAEAEAEEERKRQEAAEAAAKEAKRKTEEEAKKKAEANNQSQSVGTVGCNTATRNNNPAAIDVLVNKKHCLVPLSFAPADLVTTHGATISAKAANDFNRMYADAAAAGQSFTVSSSYRSYTTQVSTYNYWVSVNGQQQADTVSARPGFSEHQTGLAIDVGANGCNLNCFGGTSQYQWFQANAAKYGFIQRYYKGFEGITGYASEEWHYRYVGVAVASDMKAKGIKTLEQYWGLPGGNYN